jgi:hypothetical protein
VLHGVAERLEGGAALGAVEEEVGVRRDAERRLAEAEMLEVKCQGYFSSPALLPLFILL